MPIASSNAQLDVQESRGSSSMDGTEKDRKSFGSGPMGEEESESLYVEKNAGQVDDANEQIPKIPVPRQKYIPVSKVTLVQSLADAFNDDAKASEFLTICSFLDCILHAEHKTTLEQMRLDYKIMRSALKKEASDLSRKSKRRKKDGWMKKLADVLPLRKNRRDRKVASKVSGIAQEVSASSGSDQPDKRSSDGVLRRGESNGAAVLATENGMPSSKRITTESLSSDFAQDFGDKIIRNSIAAAGRFQRNFLKLLKNAQFQGLSARDLQLTSALNTDYLLTLPIEVDWKRVSSENAIIFRRGYAAERQEGLLFGAKLDYIQSLLLLKVFNWFSRPLLRSGTWINQKWNQLGEHVDSKSWTDGIREWLKEPLKPDVEDDLSSSIVEAFTEQENDGDLPFWIAAQQAVPRYEAFLSSAGSRGMLIRKILVWMRLLPPQSAGLSIMFDSDHSASEPHLRRNYLTRISMRDIWLPASKMVCGGNVWKRMRSAFYVFFSRSTLQEPAFRELVLLYNIPKNSNGDTQREEVPNLHLKIYGKIPIPDLKVIFPNKKLSFRILDTVRLDIATIIGLLAFLVNYRFDDFLSSPSAFLLDIIATSALIVYITRVGLGYKQTFDRYQLLVNKTLYEKTLASDFGAVHFLVDASEQQQFKEVILAYALLMQAQNGQVESPKMLAEECERFLYNQFKEQTEMPVDDALQILARLGLVVGGEAGSSAGTDDLKGLSTIQVLSHVQSVEMLQAKWRKLLYDQSMWIPFQREIHPIRSIN